MCVWGWGLSGVEEGEWGGVEWKCPKDVKQGSPERQWNDLQETGTGSVRQCYSAWVLVSTDAWFLGYEFYMMLEIPTPTDAAGLCCWILRHRPWCQRPLSLSSSLSMLCWPPNLANCHLFPCLHQLPVNVPVVTWTGLHFKIFIVYLEICFEAKRISLFFVFHWTQSRICWNCISWHFLSIPPHWLIWENLTKKHELNRTGLESVKIINDIIAAS